MPVCRVEIARGLVGKDDQGLLTRARDDGDALPFGLRKARWGL